VCCYSKLPYLLGIYCFRYFSSSSPVDLYRLKCILQLWNWILQFVMRKFQIYVHVVIINCISLLYVTCTGSYFKLFHLLLCNYLVFHYEQILNTLIALCNFLRVLFDSLKGLNSIIFRYIEAHRQITTRLWSTKSSHCCSRGCHDVSFKYIIHLFVTNIVLGLMGLLQL